ncbi:unnamed protein product, partial [Closterium sp. NIES-53]
MRIHSLRFDLPLLAPLSHPTARGTAFPRILSGIPPRGFTLSSLDAYQRYGALNVQAGTTFLTPLSPCPAPLPTAQARAFFISYHLFHFPHLAPVSLPSHLSQHEAGHFLISYLVGIPPRAFTLSSLDAYQRYGALNVQAGTTFLDLDFQEQTGTRQIKSDMLDAVSCVALAGVCAEYLQFGVAEGGISDIQQLDFLYKSLGFTQSKSDDVVRWAVLN